MAATLVTGLVIEAIQKIASGCSGMVFARSRKPTARRYAILPLRAIAVTAPEKAPASTCDCCQAPIRASRDAEKPSASGSPAGAALCARAAVARQSINNVAKRRCRRFIGEVLIQRREAQLCSIRRMAATEPRYRRHSSGVALRSPRLSAARDLTADRLHAGVSDAILPRRRPILDDPALLDHPGDRARTDARRKRAAIPDRVDRNSFEVRGDVRRAGAKGLCSNQHRQHFGTPAYRRGAAGQFVADLEGILAGPGERPELLVLVRGP